MIIPSSPEDRMAASLAKIEAEALQLSAEERVRLADYLLASVAGDPGIEQAWTEEIERRLAEVEAGAPLVAIEDAVARARRAIS
jgi:putative addiction module component (TIGR02574 family)